MLKDSPEAMIINKNTGVFQPLYGGISIDLESTSGALSLLPGNEKYLVLDLGFVGIGCLIVGGAFFAPMPSLSKTSRTSFGLPPEKALDLVLLNRDTALTLAMP